MEIQVSKCRHDVSCGNSSWFQYAGIKARCVGTKASYAGTYKGEYCRDKASYAGTKSRYMCRHKDESNIIKH